MSKQIFDTDIINHNGEEITVNTYMDDHLEITEEFERECILFRVSEEGHKLSIVLKGKEVESATSEDLVTYRFNGKTFKVNDNDECCNTSSEQMSLIDVADWMLSQY